MKMIEYPFIKPLKEWLNRYIDPAQLGFIQKQFSKQKITF